MSIEGALTITGFMEKPELNWLAQQAALHTQIVEVGSFYGRSTRVLADNTKGYVIAVDDWTGPRDATMSWKLRQEIYGKFCENLKEHIESKRVIPWRINHDDLAVEKIPVAEGIVGQPVFDMVFIDGDHKYESILRDIKFWLPLLKVGGLLCGHDYELKQPSVIQAVNETIGDPGMALGTNIWWYEKPQALGESA